MKKTTSLILMLLGITSSIIYGSCSKDKNEITAARTPHEILASTAWETTNAKNQQGQRIALDDERVANYVGYAYYDNAGTFRIYDLQDSIKMQGDWAVSTDGKTRVIVAKNPETGATLFTRVVDITVLTPREFTYRIYPNPADRSLYLDIIHRPTSHPKPE